MWQKTPLEVSASPHIFIPKSHQIVQECKSVREFSFCPPPPLPGERYSKYPGFFSLRPSRNRRHVWKNSTCFSLSNLSSISIHLRTSRSFLTTLKQITLIVLTSPEENPSLAKASSRQPSSKTSPASLH